MTSTTASPARPRILQVITHLALGGAEKIAVMLARGLRERCDGAIFAVRGVARDGIGPSMRRELEEMGMPFFAGTRLPLKTGGIFFAGWQAGCVVRQFRPDIIHLHTEIPEASYWIMTVLQPRLRSLPVVRTVHNAFFWHHWRRLGRQCDRRLVPAYVAAVSHDALDAFSQLRSESGGGPPPRPPLVIYNGVAVPPLPTRSERAPGTPLRLLFAGRFAYEKGADLLPRILPGICLRDGQAGELVLHGSGACEPILRSMARHPPPGWSIRVLAPVPDLVRRIPEFDLVLVPSRFEGLSLVAVEASLLGLPVIATDAPGLREALPPDHPWKAMPGDAASFARTLQAAIDDPRAWPAAVERARRFAQGRFDVGRMCESYYQLYSQMLGDLPGRRKSA